MATPVIMPKIEMAQETATVIEWLKQEGERVEKGEPLLEVETDKVTMVVEAPGSGILAGVQVKRGEVVPVTEIIAYVVEPGEEPSEAPLQGTTEPAKTGEATKATPVARRLAEAEDVDLSEVDTSGPGGRITKSDVQATLEKKPGVGLEPERGVRGTPAARRIAREHGVDLGTVTGSGPRGRVQADDVRGFLQAQQAREPAAEVITLSRMRRTIAERMSESYQTVPHITLTVRVDMGGFEQTRRELNARTEAEDQTRVSVTMLLVKAVAWTLKRHPWLNSTMREGQADASEDIAIHLLDEINIGVAVALEDGLIVPVVHQADRKSVSEIVADVNALTRRAREGRLRPSDIAGGTFTVSNLGAFGVEQFTAIINPPQAAILAVAAIEREPVVEENDQIVVRPMMRMTLSADHRIVDGATASRFLRDLREALERPALLLW